MKLAVLLCGLSFFALHAPAQTITVPPAASVGASVGPSSSSTPTVRPSGIATPAPTPTASPSSSSVPVVDQLARLLSRVTTLEAFYTRLQTNYTRLQTNYNLLQTNYTLLQTNYTLLEASNTVLKGSLASVQKALGDSLRHDQRLTQIEQTVSALEWEPTSRVLSLVNANLALVASDAVRPGESVPAAIGNIILGSRAEIPAGNFNLVAGAGLAAYPVAGDNSVSVAGWTLRPDGSSLAVTTNLGDRYSDAAVFSSDGTLTSRSVSTGSVTTGALSTGSVSLPNGWTLRSASNQLNVQKSGQTRFGVSNEGATFNGFVSASSLMLPDWTIGQSAPEGIVGSNHLDFKYQGGIKVRMHNEPSRAGTLYTESDANVKEKFATKEDAVEWDERFAFQSLKGGWDYNGPGWYCSAASGGGTALEVPRMTCEVGIQKSLWETFRIKRV